MRDVVVYFADGAMLVEPFDDSDYREDLGEKKPTDGDWPTPFPNERGNSFAYGWMESECQSEWSAMPALIERHGAPTRLTLRDRT